MLLALTCSMALLTATPAAPPFSERVKSIKVGTLREQVRKTLGKPQEQSADAKRWTYRDPPHLPDGPYRQYTFTFEKEKVTRLEEAGVGCVLRE